MIEERKSRRGAILIPNAITTAAMAFGFYSIQQSLQGNFIHATWALFISAILDSLDGKIARLVKGTSEFGEQYDSLADLVSFGLAPGFLAISWGLGRFFGELGWAVGFVYLAGAAIRLARFNTLIGAEQSRAYFKGIPSPVAAGFPVVPVMVYSKYVSPIGLEHYALGIIYLFAVAGAGFLMVSPIRFRTFKDLQYTKYGIVPPLLGVVIILSALFVRPQLTLFGGLVAYLTWAFLEELLVLRPKEKELRAKRREARRKRREERKLRRRAERETKIRVIPGEQEERK